MKRNNCANSVQFPIETRTFCRFLTTALFLTTWVVVCTPAYAKNTILLALFDGFPPVILENAETPHLDALRATGSWSHHLVPEFPSISLTNHTSFTTGCHPKNHGILSNRFIDPDKGHYDHWPDADWRLGCQSIFEVAEAQGYRTAALYVTGRFSTAQGPRASIVNEEKEFKDFPDDRGRFDRVAELLALPSQDRPDLIVVYFNGPDSSQHFKGMDTPETVSDVERSDSIIGDLQSALSILGNGDTGTLIVGTDHGMTPVKGLVNIDRILRRHSIDAKVASGGTSSFLYLNDGADASVALEALSGYEEFDAHKKSQFPAYAHLGDSPRAPDILLTAKPSYFIEDSDLFPNFAHWMGITRIWPDVFEPPVTILHATHGYDPSMPEMHGIFYAWGHGIKVGHNIETLQIIDIHPTVASLMGITPGKPVDGKVAMEILSAE